MNPADDGTGRHSRWRGQQPTVESDECLWLDSDAGPLVRPYTVTGGRARSDGGEFDLLAFVVAGPGAGRYATHLLPEHRAILARAATPVSVAELASHVDLALGVVRVLLGDLARDGLITTHEPVGGSRPMDDHLLEAVIDGLRAL